MLRFTFWSVAILALVLLVALVAGRPYTTGFARYALWHLSPSTDFRTGSVTRGGARLRYATVGAGAPLVMLHGGFGSWLDWYAEMPTLAASRRLVLVNFRGHGGSTLGRGDFTYRKYAGDVLAVLDALGIERADFVGWSDGGNAALLLASLHPGRVGRIVAMGANANPAGLTADAARELAVGTAEDAGVFRRLLHRVQAAPGIGWRALWTRVTRLWANHPTLGEADLERIGAPVLLMLGERDAVSPEHGRWMADALPNGELEIVPDVGHDLPQAAPDAVIAAIGRFLEPAVTP